MSTRNEIIDIAKGIGILLVVYAHAHLPLSGIVIYFHMPLFFFLSGFSFKENDSIKETIIKRIKRLYVPFVAINTVFLILNPVLFSIGLEENSFGFEDYLNQALKIVTFQNAEPIISQCWYLLGLFVVSIVFKLTFNLLGKRTTAIICAFFAVAGLLTVSKNIRLEYGNCDLLNVVLISSMFYLTGCLSRNWLNKLVENKPLYIERGAILVFFAAVIAILTGRFVFHYQSDFRSNIFNIKYLIYPVAFSGIFITLIASGLMTKFANVKRLLIFLGKNTMSIFLLHTIAFKVVSIIMFKYFGYDEPLYGWGQVNGGIVWNGIHFIVGILLPMLATWIYDCQRIKLQK